MADDVLDVEMAPAARTTIEESLAVEPGEEVLIVADGRTVGIGRAFAAAAAAAGATTTTAVMPLLDSHGNEPPDAIAAAMRSVDAVVTPTTHAITHTRARLDAADAGTRIAIIRGVTEDMLIEGAMTADFEAVRARTGRLATMIDAAESARVTSAQGTDVTYSLAESSSWPLDGYYHEEYGFASLPPGEAPTAPTERTAEGTIVIDGAMDGVDAVDEPLRWTVEGGFVTDVAGGTAAAQLSRILETNGRNARNLAEFAVATNPTARAVGNPAEDKLVAGTVHFAVGDNESLGGSTRSDVHLDGVVREPTVELDGERVVDAGTLTID